MLTALGKKISICFRGLQSPEEEKLLTPHTPNKDVSTYGFSTTSTKITLNSNSQVEKHALIIINLLLESNEPTSQKQIYKEEIFRFIFISFFTAKMLYVSDSITKELSNFPEKIVLNDFSSTFEIDKSYFTTEIFITILFNQFTNLQPPTELHKRLTLQEYHADSLANFYIKSLTALIKSGDENFGKYIPKDSEKRITSDLYIIRNPIEQVNFSFEQILPILKNQYEVNGLFHGEYNNNLFILKNTDGTKMVGKFGSISFELHDSNAFYLKLCILRGNRYVEFCTLKPQKNKNVNDFVKIYDFFPFKVLKVDGSFYDLSNTDINIYNSYTASFRNTLLSLIYSNEKQGNRKENDTKLFNLIEKHQSNLADYVEIQINRDLGIS